MIINAVYVKSGIEYYIVSFIALLVFPIIPILLSCLVGAFITYISSRFKGKNYAQTLIAMVFLIGILYFLYNFENLLSNLAKMLLV